ncbi:Uncharacterised protein [Streptococcus pneumoniae]|nr:Uncharacterised protein [Streptococcus pneumoniae]CJG16833.1 Uncharacterised protein [Streptococcus pneumoniae]CMV97260.1 Uncharacterised protein [Streptococcus pneumoniae]CMX05932.1 Uncharacterised protein [Streptococcus pneumoniae]COJ78567.1 Uncharacterised protein [Streptococcus pneumoniae]
MCFLLLSWSRFLRSCFFNWASCFGRLLLWDRSARRWCHFFRSNHCLCNFCNWLRKVCNLNSLIINGHLISGQICCRSCHFFTRVCLRCLDFNFCYFFCFIDSRCQNSFWENQVHISDFVQIRKHCDIYTQGFCNGAQSITILYGITCFVVRFSQIVLDLLNTTCSPKNFFCLSCQYWGK